MLQKMRPRCFRNDQEPSQTLCHSFRKTTWQWKVFLVLTFFWSCVQEGPFQDGPLESCTERFKFPTKNTTRHAVCRVFSASTHFWLAEINDVLKRSIVESSGLRNVLHLTTDLCKMKALLQKNQQRTNTKSTRLATQFKQLPTFHSMWLSLGHSYYTWNRWILLRGVDTLPQVSCSWGYGACRPKHSKTFLFAYPSIHVQHLDVYPPGN